MSESKYKTMRHIETVRNYLNVVIRKLMDKQEKHDQTKLQSPEVEVFEEYTPKLRNCTYESNEYKKYLKEMNVALDHHYRHNDHHPEFFIGGIQNMNLINLIEMLCDWKAAGMRHADGDIMKSIEVNQKRFSFSDELKQILINTAHILNINEPFHKAKES
jgi:hypothetical protein